MASKTVKADGSVESSIQGNMEKTNPQDSAIYNALQSSLLGQADLISSADSNIETSIKNAISGVKSAQEASAARIESQFGREVNYAQDTAQSQFSDFSESRSGFATQMSAFRNLVKTTDKNLNDLEQRKQELLLQGESNAAQQIADLQLKELQYRQQAQQQVFDNLFQIGTMDQNQQQIDLAQKKFGLDKRAMDLQESQYVETKANAAFSRLASLQEMGALGQLKEEDLEALSADAMLPPGAARAIADAPQDSEIRAIGNSLVAIDPKTLKTQVLYNAPFAPRSGGSGSSSDTVSLGTGAEVSFMTASVLNGLQKLDDLTATERQNVKAEMQKIGFGSDTPPQWYKDKSNFDIDLGRVPASMDMDTLATVARSKDQNKIEKAVIEQSWRDYRESFYVGEKFLNKEFFTQVFSADQLDEKAKEAGTNPEGYLLQLEGMVNTYRQAGFSDKEILKQMQ